MATTRGAEEGDGSALVPMVAMGALEGCLQLGGGLAGLGAALLGRGGSTRELVGFAVAALLFSAVGAIGLLFWRRDVPEFRPVPERHRELDRGGVVRLVLRGRGTLLAAAVVPGAVFLGAWLAGIAAGTGMGMICLALRARLWEIHTDALLLVDRRGPQHGRFIRPV